MRLVRFRHGGRAGYGVHDGEWVFAACWEPFDRVEEEPQPLDPASVTLLAPSLPSKVVAVGLNYSDHASELGMEIPEEPILFLKASNTVLDPGGTVIYPAKSRRVDYEGELAVAIGAEARSLTEDEALGAVLGYTCALDMTARDLQARDGQWTRAKNFDTFCPLGPWVETDLDPGDLGIELRLNGEVRQSSSTSKMIFGVGALVSFISSVMTLYPGDVVLTGTPPGVGEVRPGDSVSVTIEGIGELSCDVAAE